MKHNTHEAINHTIETTLEIVKSMGLEPGEQEFVGILPLDDHQGIIFEVKEEDGERKMKIKVSDMVIVLPQLEGTLDVFKEEEK